MIKKSHFYVPTPFEIAIFLTFIVLLLASALTDYGLAENLSFWGNGLWSLLAFMTQMCLILLGGYVVASSKPVNRFLQSVSCIPRTSFQVYLLTFIVSAVACWVNWGLGLVVGAFFALEVAKQNNKAHFPLIVASSYMGFLFWHGGLSGSIPLTVGTPDNFSEKWLGVLIHFDQTVFSFFNLYLVVTLLLILSFLILYFSWSLKKENKITSFADFKIEEDKEPILESSSVFSKPAFFTLLGMMVLFFASQIFSGQFGFSLNQINFILILAGVGLHGSLQTYMGAVQRACRRLAPILVQYPLYAGIMGIMIKSGLAVKISDSFVAISTQATYPLYMFLSAGLVNLFVPSGGGQWAVQAPIVIQGAKELGVPLWKVVMAVAWGDAWTNLAQPFWALPILSIVGLGIRDIMGYCLVALVVSGLVISFFFLAF